MPTAQNPWQQPPVDNYISFVSTEFSGDRAEHEHEHESAGRPNGQLLEEALSVIDQQSRTIQRLMTLLSGEAPGAGDMG